MEFLDREIVAFEKEIEHLKSRIASGIAHDFKKMEPIWEDNICRLSAILRLMKKINEDPRFEDKE